MRPLPHLRIIRFPPKKRAALCGAAKEGGRGARLFAMPHGRPPSFPPAFTENHSASLLQRAPPAAPREGFSPSKGKTDPKQKRREKGKVPQKGPCLQKNRTLLCFGFAGAGRPRAGPSVALGGHRALSAQTRQARHFSLFQLAPLGAPAPDVALLPVQKLLRFSPALPKPAAPCPAFHGALLSEAKARLGAKNPAPWKRAGFFFFVKKGQQWGTCPPVAIRFSASSR